MIKRTLLEIVQDLLASIEDDEVNSIHDVESSTRVANIVKECFYEIVSAGELPEHWDFYELNTFSDVNSPTLMYLPDNVASIESLKYNVSETGNVQYKEIRFTPLNEFMDRMYNLDDDESNVVHYTKTYNGNTIDFLVLNDKMPEYYTTFDDQTVVFDSFMEDIDVFLVKNKTLCYGQVLPVFQLVDTYIPDLDPKQFSLLINEAKRQVFNEFRQSDNPLSAQRARRGWIRLQRDKRNVPFPYNTYNTLPNYARRTK